jgi:PHD/YefM family antitoxin component YafN of YafNO toxin-antitoxin module
MKSVTSRAFNQDVSQAKRLARVEPVFVTDRGKPTHVLMSIDAFRALASPAETLIDLLAIDEPVAAEPDWRAAASWGRGETP